MEGNAGTSGHTRPDVCEGDNRPLAWLDRSVVVIEGKPVPKGRPRVLRSGHTYTPKRTKDAEDLIAAEYALQGGKRFEGPVSLVCHFIMPIPKSRQREVKQDDWCTVRNGDVDSLLKTVMDGLNGLAYDDDQQVVDIRATKRYGDHAHTVVSVYNLA